MFLRSSLNATQLNKDFATNTHDFLYYYSIMLSYPSKSDSVSSNRKIGQVSVKAYTYHAKPSYVNLLIYQLICRVLLPLYIF